MRQYPVDAGSTSKAGSSAIARTSSQEKGPSRRHQISTYVIEVQNAIRLRDEYLNRLREYVHRGGWQKLRNDIGNLIDLLRPQTIDVIERVRDWQAYVGKPKPFSYGIYPNYVLTIPHSMDFLCKVQGFEDWLGFPARRNPLLVPNGAQLLPAQQQLQTALVPWRPNQVGSGLAAARAQRQKKGYVFVDDIPSKDIQTAVQAMLTEERLYGAVSPHKGALTAKQVISKVRRSFHTNRIFLTRQPSSSVREFKQIMKLVDLKLYPSEWDWFTSKTVQNNVGQIAMGHVIHAAVMAMLEHDPTVLTCGDRPAGELRRKSSPVLFSRPSSRKNRLSPTLIGDSPVRGEFRSKSPPPLRLPKMCLLPQFDIDTATKAYEASKKRKKAADADVQRCKQRLESLARDLEGVRNARNGGGTGDAMILLPRVAGALSSNRKSDKKAFKKARKFRERQLSELIAGAEAALDSVMHHRHECTVALLRDSAALRETQAALKANRERKAAMVCRFSWRLYANSDCRCESCHLASPVFVSLFMPSLQ